MDQLRGKVAVVTGAAGGIGAALSRRLQREGCRLALVDLQEPRDLGGPNDSLHAVDVADPDAWDDLAAAVRERHGGADLLVNNAGITVYGSFAEQSRADLDRIVDVNLKGVLHGCRAFLPELARRGGGHIVNVASLAGRVAFPLQSTYCATKYAVRGFSAALRMELSTQSIGVTAVLPGAVATRLLEEAASYDRATSQRLAALMKAGGLHPDRVADRILRAIRRNDAEALIGWDALVATGAHALSPSALYGALSLMYRARTRHPDAASD
jgi:short-subunit dehydrogenase